MKIFPLKPMSNYDRISNILDIMHKCSPKSLEKAHLESKPDIFQKSSVEKSISKGKLW